VSRVELSAGRALTSGFYGSLIATVSIKANGSLERIQIDRFFRQ